MKSEAKLLVVDETFERSKEEVGGCKKTCLWGKQAFAYTYTHKKKMNFVLKAISLSADEKLNSSRVLIHLKFLKSNRK